ncbi:DUF397 domain-containing protein [Phytohabitans rumicis]|uniref:DUF397 domain-containing protein n=1 Tax=Phytohabitans rumicis TaxID=1076125 RepID=UPI001566AFBA|nr:DUF397 domain-containing protein [Phytohabitans rumicis]
MADTANPRWRKSSRCDSSTCLEVARVADRVIVRDSADPSGPTLTFSPGDWTAFIRTVIGSLRSDLSL